MKSQKNHTREVVVVGGGVAGMQAAIRLAEQGVRVTLIEKKHELGGHIRSWYHLFPSFTPAQEVYDALHERFASHDIELITSAEATEINPTSVTLADGRVLHTKAVIIATGFEIFDARRKEEYGYGLYDHVYTSADLELLLHEGEAGEGLAGALGFTPRRIALLHCVGSRDEKVCQPHCSKVCCITGVKQAIELKKRFPDAEIFNFYMDIRMFGPGYEEMYREAQQKYNIHFIRGRISEASPTFDGRLQIKAEDTLTGRPLRMSVDMFVLLIGMQAGPNFGLPHADSGFLEPQDLFLGNVVAPAQAGTLGGLFYAGTVSAPKAIGESLNEGIAAADAAAAYIKQK